LNKIVLFLYPNRFNEIDWERFELKYFLQEYKVYIYDLSFLLKSDSKKTKLDYFNNDYILRFHNILSLFKSLYNLIIKYGISNIHIINLVKYQNFRDKLILLFISILKFKIVSFYNPGIPSVKPIGNQNKSSKLFLNFYTFNFINTVFFRYFFSFITNKRMAILGNYNDKNIIQKKYPFNKFISGSSWDYSTFLRKRDLINKNVLLNIKYALHLDGCGPAFVGDEALTNWDRKYYHPETNDRWYSGLNNFFKFVEAKYNIKYVIAAHPRTNPKLVSRLYDGRESFKGNTIELIKDSLMVSTRGSTAISYAAIYSKPIVFLTSNAYLSWEKHIIDMENTLNFWQKKQLNIDSNEYKNDFVIPQVNKRLCEKYIKFFMSSSQEPNHLIIKKFFNSL
tara:strand:+ start:20552 stop:21733 length:1182 start_codon:yes stop_codon:yes gene_type:complete